MYAWARTGQSSPIGLDFKDTSIDGDGFAVGPGTEFEWIALGVHYQQLQKSPSETVGQTPNYIHEAKAAPRAPARIH